ncbi:MAG: hypothetical protein SPG61_01695 [Arcanobacterium sp.]|nr:hypothetical protein [Arcanobacterium sp.]
MANAQYWTAAENALGITADDWINFFENHPEGDTTSHTELARRSAARLAEYAVDNPNLQEANLFWWAQSIAIAYEYEKGWRSQGQRCDGSFAASASKTLSGTLDQIFTLWQEFITENLLFVDGVPWESEPRLSVTEKWRYWRCSLANGIAISVNITAKSVTPEKEKCIIAADVTKLESTEQVLLMKESWKTILQDFAQWMSN